MSKRLLFTTAVPVPILLLTQRKASAFTFWVDNSGSMQSKAEFADLLIQSLSGYSNNVFTLGLFGGVDPTPIIIAQGSAADVSAAFQKNATFNGGIEPGFQAIEISKDSCLTTVVTDEPSNGHPQFLPVGSKTVILVGTDPAFKGSGYGQSYNEIVDPSNYHNIAGAVANPEKFAKETVFSILQKGATDCDLTQPVPKSANDVILKAPVVQFTNQLVQQQQSFLQQQASAQQQLLTQQQIKQNYLSSIGQNQARLAQLQAQQAQNNANKIPWENYISDAQTSYLQNICNIGAIPGSISQFTNRGVEANVVGCSVTKNGLSPTLNLRTEHKFWPNDPFYQFETTITGNPFAVTQGGGPLFSDDFLQEIKGPKKPGLPRPGVELVDGWIFDYDWGTKTDLDIVGYYSKAFTSFYNQGNPALQGQIQALQSQIAAEQAEILQLDQQITQTSQQISTLQAQIAEVNAGLSTTGTEVVNWVQVVTNQTLPLPVPQKDPARVPEAGGVFPILIIGVLTFLARKKKKAS